MPENVDPVAQGLRAAVERHTDTLPPADDLPERIQSRVRRRHRQRQLLVGGVGTAALATMLVAAILVVPSDDPGNVSTTDDTSTTTATTEPTPSTTMTPPTTGEPAPPDRSTAPTAGGTTTTTTTPEPQIGPDTPLSIDGVGPIKVGMTVYEAEDVAGLPVNLAESAGDTSTCQTGQIGQTGLWLIIETNGTPGEDRKLGIVKVVEEGKSTVDGVQVGDPVDRVEAIYGSPARRVPSPYVDGGEVLVYPQGDHAYGIVTDGSAVTRVQSGAADRVPTLEGCA